MLVRVNLAYRRLRLAQPRERAPLEWPEILQHAVFVG